MALAHREIPRVVAIILEHVELHTAIRLFEQLAAVRAGNKSYRETISRILAELRKVHA